MFSRVRIPQVILFLVIFLLLLIIPCSSTIQNPCPCDKTTSTCDNQCCCDKDCPAYLVLYWRNNLLCSYRSFNTMCYSEGIMYRISSKTAGIISNDQIADSSNMKCIDVDTDTVNNSRSVMTTTSIENNKLVREAPTITSDLVDDQTKFLNTYSGFQFGLANIQATIITGSDPILLGTGDSLHIFGDLAKSEITITNFQNAIQGSVPGTTSTTRQIQAIVSYQKQGYMRYPLYKIQAIDVGTPMSKTASSSRTDILCDDINTEVWSIQNSVPSTPVFFPQLPQDIFYPIWFDFSSVNSAISILIILVIFGSL